MISNYYSVLLSKVEDYTGNPDQLLKYNIDRMYDGDHLDYKILNKGDYILTNQSGKSIVVKPSTLDNVAQPLPSAPEKVLKWIEYCKNCKYNIFQSHDLDKIDKDVTEWMDKYPTKYSIIWLYGGNKLE